MYPICICKAINSTIALFRLRLDNSKLKLLHHELRVHDKEELALKKIKSEDGDNEGLREAEVRYIFFIQSFLAKFQVRSHNTDLMTSRNPRLPLLQ